MDMQVIRATTLLAAPAVPGENLLSKLGIGQSVQSKAGTSLLRLVQADLASPDEKASFSSAGKSS